MRIEGVTIPSSFIRLDDHTTAADAFVNVRDHARMRSNHNILVAKRLRREVFHLVFNHSISNAPFNYRCRNRVGQAGVQPIIFLNQILVSQWTNEIDIVIEACKDAIDGSSGFTDDPFVKAKLYRDPGTPGGDNLESVTISAATGSPAKYTLTLPVPQTRSVAAPWYGMEYYWLVIYGDTLVDTAYAKDANKTVAAWGERWVELTGASTSSLGSVIYCNTDLTVAPRQVTSVDTSGSPYRYYVDQPWSRDLVPGTDAMTIREIQGIDFYSISAYEETVTSLVQRDAPL